MHRKKQEPFRATLSMRYANELDLEVIPISLVL